MNELNRLKGWLYHQRCRIRLDRERVERKERREEELAKKESEQPALFQF